MVTSPFPWAAWANLTHIWTKPMLAAVQDLKYFPGQPIPEQTLVHVQVTPMGRDYQYISPMTVNASAIMKHCSAQQDSVNIAESGMQLTKTAADLPYLILLCQGGWWSATVPGFKYSYILAPCSQSSPFRAIESVLEDSQHFALLCTVQLKLCLFLRTA